MGLFYRSLQCASVVSPSPGLGATANVKNNRLRQKYNYSSRYFKRTITNEILEHHINQFTASRELARSSLSYLHKGDDCLDHTVREKAVLLGLLLVANLTLDVQENTLSTIQISRQTITVCCIVVAFFLSPIIIITLASLSSLRISVIKLTSSYVASGTRCHQLVPGERL